MNTAEFRQNLLKMSTKEIVNKVDYYSSFEPRGLNYQNMLNLYEAELERRFLAWEVTEV